MAVGTAGTAVPVRAPAGKRVWRWLVAAGRRGLAALASRRRRRGAFQREEFTTVWTAGLSRGVTLFVAGPRTAARRDEEPEG